MPPLLRNAVLMVTLALTPLVFWPVPLGPIAPSVPLLMLLPLALCFFVRPDSIRVAADTFSRYFPFWAGNIVYLAVMLAHSTITPEATGPTSFISKLLFLALSFLIAAEVSQLKGMYVCLPLLRNTAMLGTLILLVAFAWKARATGIHLPSEIQSLVGGGFERWQRVTMLVFNGTTDGEKLDDNSVVFKNPVSYSIATFLFFAITSGSCASGPINRSLILAMVLAASSLLVSMFCRTAMIGAVFGVMAYLFTSWNVSRSRRGLTAFMLGCLIVAAIVGTVLAGNLGAVSRKFDDTATLETRLEQIKTALVMLEEPRNLLFGIGPKSAFEGLRIHNLLIGSLVEGGVAGFCGATLQFLFPLFMAWRWCLQSRTERKDKRALAGLAFALILLVSIRSLTGGASGYHDLISFAQVGLAFGLRSFVVRQSQQIESPSFAAMSTESEDELQSND